MTVLGHICSKYFIQFFLIGLKQMKSLAKVHQNLRLPKIKM